MAGLDTGDGSATVTVGAQAMRHVHALAATPGVGAHGSGQIVNVSLLNALVASPGTALRAGGTLRHVHRLTTIKTRAYIRINSALVVQQPGLPAFVLLGRTDAKAVSLLDTTSEGQTVYGLVYRTRVIQTDLPYHLRSTVGNQEVHTSRKRVTRVVVFGSGTLLAGSTITVNCDGRQETYALPQTLPSDVSGQGILIFQELTAAMIGRVLDVELNLNGTSIVLQDVLVEINFVG